jgi:hypothetical protein
MRVEMETIATTHLHVGVVIYKCLRNLLKPGWPQEAVAKVDLPESVDGRKRGSHCCATGRTECVVIEVQNAEVGVGRYCASKRCDSRGLDPVLRHQNLLETLHQLKSRCNLCGTLVFLP